MKKFINFSLKTFSTKLFNKPIIQINRLCNNRKYFCEKPKDDIASEFEKLLENNENDVEKRIKLVSVKLMSMTKSNEALSYFDEKYIKALVDDIQAEEIILLIYFYTSMLERESIESGNRSNIVDKRLDRYIKMMEERIDELDMTNLLALCWSSSILINKFGYVFSQEFVKRLVNKLPDELPIDKKGDISTLCFSISTLADENEPEILSLITDKITKYSKMFCNFF
jgi:hypothetical protein